MDEILESILKEYYSETAGKILRTALEMFAVGTPAAVRMRDLANKAGVNLASVNYYFKSKDDLYMEIAKLIVKLFQKQYEPYIERYENLKVTRKSKDARALIKDILSSRIRCESEHNRYSRYIVLILMREELCNGEAFDLFLKELFIPRTRMLSKLVEIATGDRIKGEDARIAAKILLGQTHLFNSARLGVKMDMNWKVFGEMEAEKVRKINSEFIDKIFNKGKNQDELIEEYKQILREVSTMGEEKVCNTANYILKNIMENTYKLDVPLVVDINKGTDWYDAK